MYLVVLPDLTVDALELRDEMGITGPICAGCDKHIAFRKSLALVRSLDPDGANTVLACQECTQAEEVPHDGVWLEIDPSDLEPRLR